MTKRFKRGLWWVKRDFRLNDNDALHNALAQCDTVLALFIVEPDVCSGPDTSYLHFHAWRHASDHLAEQLLRLGGRLLIRTGEAQSVLDSLLRDFQFDALFSHQETGSAVTFKRDQLVHDWATRQQLPWLEFQQNGVVRGLNDRDKRQAFINERLFETPVRVSPSQIVPWSELPDSESWPRFDKVSGKPIDTRIQLSEVQSVTEACAQRTLRTFLYNRGVGYSGGISSPNSAFSAGSRLSTHLAWGTISLRQVFQALEVRNRELVPQAGAQSAQWRKSLNAFKARLHWHDHFIQRLESAPNMETEAINPAYRHISYGDCEPVLQAWMAGNTGLPLIDACIRCLAATGFLNFRMRAMLVTTGCFGLAQSWQAIQYPLARLFLDYEPGIHFSQVQMQAGLVGINTLRVYSPHKQLIDQDPNARFVKQWIPELREFDANTIANYNECSLGDYPAPVVDINATAKIMKDQIYAIRNSEEGRSEATRMLTLHGSRKRTPTRKRPKVNRRHTPDVQMKLDFD